MLLLKVCGMKDNSNIAELIQLQPDFIGFIFHEKSPRNVVDHIEVNFPSNIKKVGVFVNESEEFIHSKIISFKLNSAQLHGNESPEFCQKIKDLGVDIIKAFNIHPEFDFKQLKAYEPYCDYFLFDAFGKKAGGNGIVFNWELLNQYSENIPFLLSGGIDETMVDQIKIFKHSQFVGIDINSKFETANCYKNITNIKLFKDELFS
ncbi:phosphoribosylanthranilate isomerase [Vicingus serpentipes]|uniref:N-(5'-phosphoribosyl)anthranilate isomerase n=2 Tax=Vicingus serpentipes TaxID=1926625 RepID=A0A5C6RSL5_9FLAO|nr:phosphoribosylanthranilate isomerase [Vicingus serpentipes]